MQKISPPIFVLFVLLSIPGSTSSQASERVRRPAQNKADTGSVASAAPAIRAKEDCGCEVKEPSDVLATANGVKINRSEIEAATKDDIDAIERRVVSSRSRELDLEINSILLDEEAKKHGVAPSKLIEEEVVSKVPKPTEAEAQAYYDKNKGRISGDFKDIKDNLIDYMLNARQRDQAQKYAQSLRSAGQVQVLVKEVTPPHDATERERVFATVNGRKITSGDIEDNLRPIIYKAQVQIYR
ncbi:MAG: hypothetical protein ACREDR_04315, partial [Blastocatellia bacterium]